MSTTSNPDQRLAELSNNLAGEVIARDHDHYDSARLVFNRMIDRYPEAIAICNSVADVQAVVRYAKERGLALAIRGGGHSGAGLGVCDHGLVLDLSGMKEVLVDPEKGTVQVGGGCTQGELTQATEQFGLAVPAGVISSTGIGGLTLGGGTGYLTRKLGLTIDSLIEAELVLADGSIAKASSEENADLFWAIRGGGGNFGVVTSFTFRAHPLSELYAGPMLWEMEHAREVLTWFRDESSSWPDDLYGFFAFIEVPAGPPFPGELHGKKVCAMIWAYSGPAEQGEAALKVVERLPKPAFRMTGPMPYSVLQSMFDAIYPPGDQWYWKGDFLKEIPDKAVDLHLRFGQDLPSSKSTMHLYPVDGCAGRIDPKSTAFSYRDARWSMVIVGVDPDPANAAKITEWTKSYWSALHEFSMGGAYVNFMMEEGAERVKLTYRDNYDRLVSIKRKYDPDNFFRINQNIAPSE